MVIGRHSVWAAFVIGTIDENPADAHVGEGDLLRAAIAHDPTDLTDREAAAVWGEGRHAHMMADDEVPMRRKPDEPEVCALALLGLVAALSGQSAVAGTRHHTTSQRIRDAHAYSAPLVSCPAASAPYFDEALSPPAGH